VSGDGSSVGAAGSYDMMSGYYPYYVTSGDMNAAAFWPLGNTAVSPAAVSYDYRHMDYTSAMANYGYPGFGWFTGSGWETGSGSVKNDPSTAYATNGGYYGLGTPSAYSGAAAACRQEQDADVSSIDHRMQMMNLEASQQANDTAKDQTVASNGFHHDRSWAAVATHSPHSYSAKSRGSALQQTPWMPGSMWDGRHTGYAGRPTYDAGSSRRRPTNTGARAGVTAANSSDSSVAAATGKPAGSQSISSQTNPYNPKEFDLSPKSARFFIIKSYAEDDIHRSIKYGIWCSTEYGNKRLDAAYREREGKGPVFLFFSVNGSGHFCGIAEMTSPVDYETSAEVWQQGKKWKGQFTVKWIYVKDVPNSQLRHIRLENNEGKPVTNSRDTQEVPPEKGCQVLRIIHQYRHTTSIFDDFSHYEESQRQEDNTYVDGSVV
jgi:hypothetical protein